MTCEICQTTKSPKVTPKDQKTPWSMISLELYWIVVKIPTRLYVHTYRSRYIFEVRFIMLDTKSDLRLL